MDGTFLRSTELLEGAGLFGAEWEKNVTPLESPKQAFSFSAFRCLLLFSTFKHTNQKSHSCFGWLAASSVDDTVETGDRNSRWRQVRRTVPLKVLPYRELGQERLYVIQCPLTVDTGAI